MRPQNRNAMTAILLRFRESLLEECHMVGRANQLICLPDRNCQRREIEVATICAAIADKAAHFVEFS